MDELFNLMIGAFVVIGFIGTIVGAIGHGTKQTQQRPPQRATPQQAQPQRQRAVRRPDPAKTMLPPREAQTRQVIQPTLHDHSGMYEGSLHADDGTEGTDPHDHGFDHEVVMPSEHSEEAINRSLREAKAAPAAAPRPALRFNPQNIASAFVLQEVLRRPRR